MSGEKFKEFSEQAVTRTWNHAEEYAKVAARQENEANLMGKFMRGAARQLAVACEACGAYEWMALGYLAVCSALIMIFRGNLGRPFHLLEINLFVAGLMLTLCSVEARSVERAGRDGATFTTRWWHFWRHWYPHLFFLFCFEELAHLMTLVTPRWQDEMLLAFDQRLTGVTPTIWLEHLATPGRNEFMQFAYLTYFVYLVVLGGILYYRKDWRAYWSVMTYSMAGYSIGYLIAMFVPVQSPWFSLAGAWHAPLSGGPFTATINFIEHYGRVRGAAFPSEHVAGSVAVLWGAWKHRRWLFWVMLPLVALMCVSTIWGRYHYIADIFAGIATGTLGYLIGSWVMGRKGAVAADGAARTGGERSRLKLFGQSEHRMLRHRAGVFEITRELQEQRFRIRRADELQPDGQVILCKSAGDGDGWNAGEIGGTIKAQK